MTIAFGDTLSSMCLQLQSLPWIKSVGKCDFHELYFLSSQTDLHRETYGKTWCVGNKPLIIENPAMLAIQQKNDECNTDDVLNNSATTPVTPTKYPVSMTLF